MRLRTRRDPRSGAWRQNTGDTTKETTQHAPAVIAPPRTPPRTKTQKLVSLAYNSHVSNTPHRCGRAVLATIMSIGAETTNATIGIAVAV